MPRAILLFATAVLLLLTGCKGCGPDDSCEDVVCVQGDVCEEGVCVPDDQPPCDPACEQGEICQGGACVSLDPQCEAVGEECDPSRPVNDEFFCLDFDGLGPRPGICMEGCAPDGSCPAGALCFLLSGGSDPVCNSNEECPEGTECAEGACRQTICRPSECEGFLDGISTCEDLYGTTSGFENGSQCYAVGNGAEYCYPAGTVGEGEPCVDPIDAIISQQFTETCASGLACVDGECRVACGDDDACVSDQECILAEENFIGPGVGICGNVCTPFEIGSCGSGQTCLPISADDGVCADAGDTEALQACTPGAGDCEDGTICVGFQDSPSVARCQPLCNLTVADPNDAGLVGEFAQSQRDATCPQPDSIDAWLSIFNLAEIGVPLDIYIGDEQTPTVESLPLDARTDADQDAAGDQWIAVEPGTHALRVLPAGAPRTDPPLAESTLNLGVDEAATLIVLPDAGSNDEVSLVELAPLRGLEPPSAGAVSIRIVDGLIDGGTVDVIVVPPMDDLTDPATQTELAAGLMPESVSDFVELAAGDHDLLVFPAGDPRTDRATALLDTEISVEADSTLTLALRGTVDPDDTPNAGSAIFDAVEAPAAGAGGATFTCVDAGNDVFGFCQQNCPADSSGFGGDVCEGDMSCHPSFLTANARWANLCAPLGSLGLGEPCDPFREFAGCGEGLYCLEFGNTATDFDPVRRGRCTSYCVTDDGEEASLVCDAAQSCEEISFDAEFTIGRCGYPCEPNDDYEDLDCPQGLQSCKPRASLNDDPADPDAFPTTRVEQSFCSASGDIAFESMCAGSDCVPGSECMFPRSEQTDFVSTILSQYFGAPGLTPVCTPQCDPFDNNSSSSSCEQDETCLFNFPWSAEVGHCTPIVEDRAPLEGCTQPGLACGRDSICALNGGTATCFQFCQYDGPDTAGMLQPETCKPGFFCAPFVNDIGVCLSP